VRAEVLAAIIAEIFRLSEFVPEEFRLATKEHQRNYGEILLDFSYFKMAELANQRIENNPVRRRPLRQRMLEGQRQTHALALLPLCVRACVRKRGGQSGPVSLCVDGVRWSTLAQGLCQCMRACANVALCVLLLLLLLLQDLLDRDDAFQESHIGIVTRFYLLFESIFKYVKDLVRYLSDLDEGVFIQQSLEVRTQPPHLISVPMQGEGSLCVRAECVRRSSSMMCLCGGCGRCLGVRC
jgi:hypothetical protein